MSDVSSNLALLFSSKKVLIDTTFLFDQYAFRGIGRYGNEVVKRLINYALEDQIEIALVGFLSLEQNLSQLGFLQLASEDFLEKVKFYSLGNPTPSSIGNLKRWEKEYKPVIEKFKPNIFFAAHFERGLPSVPKFKEKLKFVPKTVVMAHDTIPLATNKYSSRGVVINLIKKLFYKKMWEGVVNADLVLTNTDFSKKDLIKYGGVVEEKIKRIYLGIDKSFFKEKFNIETTEQEEILSSFGVIGKKYFIYDSGLEENKGINELIQIYKKVSTSRTEGIPENLLIIGKDLSKGEDGNIKPNTFNGEIFLKKAKDYNILDHIITTDKISDLHLKVLLFHASFYINLSKYEGFGFGPLQAMAAEVPAIVSNSSCLPEVTDGGALLVDTNDIANASKQILNFVSNNEIIEKQVKAGAEIVKRYDWEETAAQTWEQIKKLLIS